MSFLPARRRRTARSLLVVAVLPGALSACGGGNPDVGANPGEDGVRDVVRVFAAALAEGDGPRACSLMSARAQQSLLARAPKASNCPAAVTTLAGTIPPAAATALRSASPDAVTIHDTRAQVDLAQAGIPPAAVEGVFPGPVWHLHVEDLRWGIDLPEGA